MNLFKKIVAGASIFAVAVVTVAPGVSAYTNAQLDAANTLAASGVIVDHSNDPMAYNMDQTVLRQEIAAVARGVYEVDNGMAVNSAKADTCMNLFSDVSATNPNTWACYTVEGLRNASIIAANPTFRPEENITKSEALGMVVKAACGTDYMFDASSTMTWQQQLGAYASAKGIASFSDYTTAATRGFTFEAGVNAMNACSNTTDDSTDSLLDDLLSDLDNDDTTTNTGTTTDDSDTTSTTTGPLEVTLSPSTAASATVPGKSNGVAVASFDFTAGSTDVTINQVTVQRSGLSDEDTLDQLAAFSENGRASNGKDDSQNNDTEAQLNISGGGLVVMAGETRTLTIVADLGSAANAANDEFAIELVGVNASGEVNVNGSLKGNLMRVGSIDAPEITITNGGSVSDPQLGEKGADIFEFEIEGASDDDVTVNVITFEGNGDAEDDLMNFELYHDNDLIASTTSMNGDYLTFMIDGGILIEEDENEDFTVTADVIEGAGDTITFGIDEPLDVSASSVRLGAGAAVNVTNANFDSITIEAGELTIVEVDLGYDEIREDKDNVEIAKFEVFNAAGQNLELQNFGVLIVVDDNGTAQLTGNTTALNVIEVFDEIELYNEDNGSTYDLDAGTATRVGNESMTVFSDNSVDATIPEGTSTWSIRVDTAEEIDMFDDVTFDISFDTGAGTSATGFFYVEETEDDEAVTDITPSNLSFDPIDGAEAGAEISLVPLADRDVVRGADDVKALEFTIEAEETSSLTLDEVEVAIAQASGTTVAAVNQQITSIKLYQGSISEANLLDTENGNDIGTNGKVTFDDVNDFEIAANDTETFIVTLSIADSSDAVTGTDYTVALTDLDLEDDENDNVSVDTMLTQTFLGDTTSLISARQLAVTNAGTIQTVALDDANDANEFAKLALAGEDIVVASFDVRADNEEVDVDTATFTIAGFAGTTSLKETVTTASLLLDGVVVATNDNNDITDTEITFEDLNGDLLIPETTTELELQFNTANIGEDFTGENLVGLSVTRLVLSDAEGADSGKDTTDGDSGVVVGQTVDIVAAVVTPSVDDTFGTDDQEAELTLTVDGGDNTTNGGDAVQAELTVLKISVSSFSGAAGDITVFNSNGTQIGTAPVAANGDVTVTMTAADSIGSDEETYRIETTAEAIYRVAKDGVTYTINGANSTTTKLENTLSIGQYANSN